ncbi:MAG: DUF4386 domain-containing protein [Acidobacteriales bacterium]|nr:DUF4386 domain-containing protein [Terriglobales bacterium]
MSTAMLGRMTLSCPRRKARIAGFLYLIVIAGGIFAEIWVRGRLVVSGDAAATAHNIMAHQLLYRLGFAAEIFYCACNVPLILIFYELFKIVNKNGALLVVYFSLVGTAVESVSLLLHFAPLVLLGGGHYLSAFSAEQLQALSYMSLRLFEYGFCICLVFFGCYCLVFAYLICKSTFFPKFLAVLLVIEGFLYLTNSFANFLAPAAAARIFPYLAASGLAEVSLCLWLMIVGVNVERWREQAAA